MPIEQHEQDTVYQYRLNTNMPDCLIHSTIAIEPATNRTYLSYSPIRQAKINGIDLDKWFAENLTGLVAFEKYYGSHSSMVALLFSEESDRLKFMLQFGEHCSGTKDLVTKND